jgi:hypothetical protein
VTIAVAEGVDAGVAAMLHGAPTIVGNVVLQRIINGVDKVDYHLRCTITTSSGRKLVLPLQLPVTLARSARTLARSAQVTLARSAR